MKWQRVGHSGFFTPSGEAAVLININLTPSHVTIGMAFFEIVLSDAELSVAYQLQVQTHGGETLLYEDPYAFGPALTDLDRYLLAEGTPRKSV